MHSISSETQTQGNNTSPGWEAFAAHYLRYEEQPLAHLSLDTSRLAAQKDNSIEWEALSSHYQALSDKALAEMKEIESGAVVNTEEGRMVGHYWLRDASLAPSPELQDQINTRRQMAEDFAKEVHGSGQYTQMLLIGIGGSALGPQLLAESLSRCGAADKGLKAHFIDNCDPHGIDTVLENLSDHLDKTIVLAVSKSGRTPETRNGMIEVRRHFEEAGIEFAPRAVAITGEGSQLDLQAQEEGWLRIFPMSDWVGGRTSVMSVVGLVPAALMGVQIEPFLEGAAIMDRSTREGPAQSNMALRMALSWYHAGAGQGDKSMVVLPYRDSLSLLSRYLQQLVMESLGKKHNRSGDEVHQGLSVYGNKGSTDQHAYVQQLRDGLNNFFAVFIEVQEGRSGASMDLGDGTISGDHLQGFLRGTRKALYEGGRQSLTLSLAHADEVHLGALIALFERAVGFYAAMIDVNAYHQPGVEAGKEAAAEFLKVLKETELALQAAGSASASALAQQSGQDVEETWHCLNHLAANHSKVTVEKGGSPEEDQFTYL